MNKSYFYCWQCKNWNIIEQPNNSSIDTPNCHCIDDWNQMEWVGDNEKGLHSLTLLIFKRGLDYKGQRKDRLKKYKPPYSESPHFVNCERFFMAHWLKINQRQIGLNSGLGTLENLLDQDNVHNAIKDQPIMLSQRDVDVAACVIQWLGTNCGACFLQDVERSIQRERERRAKRQSVNMKSTDADGKTK